MQPPVGREAKSKKGGEANGGSFRKAPPKKNGNWNCGGQKNKIEDKRFGGGGGGAYQSEKRLTIKVARWHDKFGNYGGKWDFHLW